MDPETEISLVALVRSGRDVRVELSNGEILKLAADSLPPALSVGGPPLNDLLLQSLRDSAQRKLISRQVFNLIDRRLMTRRTVLEKLTARGWTPELCKQVLEIFSEQGLLSDRIFAEAWCRDTLRAKAVGAYFLKSKLMGKGVAADLAAGVVRDILSPQQEQENALTAARKWWARQSGEVDANCLAKGIRHLQSRGFAAELASDTIRRLKPQKGRS